MRWIRNSPVLCEVCGNARLSGFCCESHPPIAVLIPDAVPNDTETGGSSRRAEKGREGRGKVAEKLLSFEETTCDFVSPSDTEDVAAECGCVS